MKLSVFYHHIEKAAKAQNKSIPEILSWVKQQGINYVELESKSVKDPETLSALLNTYDLQVSSIYTSYNWTENPKEFFDWEQLKQAKLLGASKIMVIPGLYSSEDESIRALERARVLEAMSDFCKKADSENITVTIEDYDNHKSPISTIEGMKWFTDRIPSLKVTLDTGNFYYSSQNVLDAINVFAAKIVHVHCKDRMNSSDCNPCPIGKGCIPIKQCIKELSGTGYDGIYTIELFGIADCFKAISDSAKHLKSIAI